MNDESTIASEIARHTGRPVFEGEPLTEYVDRLYIEGRLSEVQRRRVQQITDGKLSGDMSYGKVKTELDELFSEYGSVSDSGSPRNDEIGNGGVLQAETEDRRGQNEQEISDRLSKRARFSTNWASISETIGRKDALFLTALVLGGGYIYFWELGSYPLATWDEGFYANLARHMVQDGYWLTPHMHWGIGNEGSTGTLGPWLRLPPLGIWFQALSMLIFGVNAFAVRAPSAAASVLTAVVVFFIGRDLFNRRVAQVSSLVFLTSPYLYRGFNGGREGALETILLLFGTLFVFAAWKTHEDGGTKWLLYTGIFAALAVLVKGFGAGYFAIVVLPLLLSEPSAFLSKSSVRPVLVSLALVLPWPLYMLLTQGELFVQQFFVEYILQRVTGEAFTWTRNPLFGFMDYPYIKQLLLEPTMYQPWVYFLIPALPVGLYLANRSSDRAFARNMIFVGWWAGSIFVALLVIGGKPWYVLPLFVPGALAIGVLFDWCIRGEFAAVVGVALGAALTFTASDYFFEPIPLATLGIGSLALVVYQPLRENATHLFPDDPPSSVTALLPGVVAIVLILAMVGTTPIPDRPESSLQSDLGRIVNEAVPPGETVFVENEMGGAFHPFAFYAQRPLAGGSIDTLNDKTSVGYAVLRRNSLSELDREHQVIETVGSDGEAIVFVELSS